MSDLRLIFSNLFRKKLRAILMMVAIFVAFLIFGVMVGFMHGLNQATEPGENERMVTVNKINFTQPLPIADINKIAAIDGVAVVSHQAWFGAYFREPKNVLIGFAVDPPTYLEIAKARIILPEDQKKSCLAERTGILVGANTAALYGWKVGDQVPMSSNIYQRTDGTRVWTFLVCGIFSGVQSTGVLMNYDYFNESRTFSKDTTNMIVFQTKNATLNEKIAAQVDELFGNSSTPTRTATASAFNKSFLDQLGNLTLIITSVVSAAFASILLVVGNTMAMAIRERTREIAVMKTIGFQSGRIFRMVLFETLLLSLIGGLLGLGAAGLALKGIAKAAAANGGGLPSNMTIDGTMMAYGLAMMILLGVLTGLIPAFTAMRLNIAAGLGRI